MGRFERLLWTMARRSAEAASRRLAFRPLVGRQNAKMGRVERLQWTMARKAAQAARVRQDARLGR